MDEQSFSDLIKTILGYTCQKATCSYRGRNYEAWYNPGYL